MLSSRKSANRRTGMYFHSDADASAPSSVRAPHGSVPVGKTRRQFTPSALRVLFSETFRLYERADTPTKSASFPAGAFQTPRELSTRANKPATEPAGGVNRSCPLLRGSE